MIEFYAMRCLHLCILWCHNQVHVHVCIKPAGDDFDTPARGRNTLELQPSVFDKSDLMFYKLKTLLRDYAVPDSPVVEGIWNISLQYIWILKLCMCMYLAWPIEAICSIICLCQFLNSNRKCTLLATIVKNEKRASFL